MQIYDYLKISQAYLAPISHLHAFFGHGMTRQDAETWL